MTDLYKLPKDILVLMISTIEQKTTDEFERKLREEPIEAYFCNTCGKCFHMNHYKEVYPDPYTVYDLYCKKCETEKQESIKQSEIRNREWIRRKEEMQREMQNF